MRQANDMHGTFKAEKKALASEEETILSLVSTYHTVFRA